MSLQLHFLANAGLCLDDGQTQVLIDAPYQGFDSFDYIPEEIEDKLIKGEAPFDRVAYQFFTHQHADHYSTEKRNAFLAYHPAIKISLPKEFHSASEELCKETVEAPCSLRFAKTENLTLVKLETRHLVDAFENVIHESLFLSFGGHRILISGDADPVGLLKMFTQDENLKKALTELGVFPIDVAIVNPFLLFLKQGKQLLETFAPEKIFVYHVPTMGDDPMNYRKVQRLGLARCKEFPEIQAFDQLDMDVQV